MIKKSFSSVDLIIYSGFNGFEGAIVILILKEFIAALGVVLGCMIISGLIYIQYRGILDKKDLLIIGIITVSVLMIASCFGVVASGLFPSLLIIGFIAGAGIIAVTSLFKLIDNLLSSIL